MALTVLQVAWPLAPVGPDAAGGAEQVLSLLDEGVVAAGHRSIVIACAGSTCAGELVTLPPVPDPIDDAARARAWAAVRRALGEVLAGGDVDVVHLHGLDFDRYLPPPGPPAMVTLHLPLSWYAPAALRPSRPETFLHPVGVAQRADAPPDVTLAEDLPNGVRLDRFRPVAVRDGPALCLGRLCPEKGFDLAADAATRAGLPLDVAGALFPYPDHVAWFEQRLRPRLDGARRWLGPVGFDAKAALLARARCVVVPSLVPETASLVAMEALASGTPVIASRVGALPDLIEHGRTGLLVPPGDVDALADALRRVDAIDGAACRAAAEARCSAERTVAVCLDRYAALRRPRRVVLRPTATRVDLPGLVARADAWSALWARVPGARAFQHPAWLLAWARAFVGDGEVVAHVVEAGGDLVGVLPLWLRREQAGVVARLAGVGVSDTLDLLAAPDRPDVVAALLAALDAEEVDVLHLDLLPEGSPLVDAPLRGLGPATPDEPCAVVGLDSWRARTRHGMLKDLRRLRRQAEREVGYAVEAADADGLDAWLDALMALHGLRWGARGGDGMLADASVRAFHRDAARALHASGRLDALTVRMEGRPVAAGHVLIDDGGASFYLHGFDPVVARRSPGALLILESIERTEARGASTFDLLRGQEPFKAAWGAIRRPQWRRTRA